MEKCVTIITVTLNRPSLWESCKSIDNQTYQNWHHIILGDGVAPTEYTESPKRSVLGFSQAIGALEPGANMRNGTPNPLLRWALTYLRLSDYVCFLDDDNQYTPSYLEKMVSQLEANSSCGIVLCGAEDLRYDQNIDGYPQLGHCDNSAFLVRREVAQSIEFPHASLEKDVVQDYEFIKLCADQYGWTRTDERLLLFGTGMNPPPQRGEVLFLESWKLAQEASYLAYDGKLDLAETAFLNAISQYHDDAWSWKKLAELYLIRGQTEKANAAFREWYDLYLKVEPSHFAVEYSYAQYLKHNNMPYAEIMRSSVGKRAEIERQDQALNNDSYQTVYCMLSHIFLEDPLKAGEYLGKCRQICFDSIQWAYQDVIWTLKAYRTDIQMNLTAYFDFFGKE